MKKQNKVSSFSLFWQWLGRQNVFLIFLALFALWFFGSKVYANYFPSNQQDLSTSEQIQKAETPKPKISITPLPKASNNPTQFENKVDCMGPDGVSFKTTRQECDSFNKSWGNVSPTPQALIDCSFPADSPCAEQSKKVTAVECKNLRCCKNYAENKYIVDTQQACDNLFQEEINRVNQVNNDLIENYSNEINEAANQISDYNCSLMLEANETQTQNLVACRNWVSNNIPRTLQIGIGSPQDNPAYGSAYSQCFNLYGTDPYPEANQQCAE